MIMLLLTVARLDGFLLTALLASVGVARRSLATAWIMIELAPIN
jgi:hypothetical protein